MDEYLFLFLSEPQVSIRLKSDRVCASNGFESFASALMVHLTSDFTNWPLMIGVEAVAASINGASTPYKSYIYLA